MTLSTKLTNRIGFTILGLTNNFAYVIMLSAAYDLLAQISPTPAPNQQETTTATWLNVTNVINNNNTLLISKPYCNAHSTSTILLADTLPSLTTKLIYPFLLVQVRTAYKAIGTALLAAISFIITGLTTNEALIFTGVICASFSSGLGEAVYLSSTPMYGDASLSGWSMGTGGAGLFGAASYALLTMILSIKIIMITMLVVPLAMLGAYFYIIKPIRDYEDEDNVSTSRERVASAVSGNGGGGDSGQPTSLSSTGGHEPNSLASQEEPIFHTSNEVKFYGGQVNLEASGSGSGAGRAKTYSAPMEPLNSFKGKLLYLPSLAKYFLPLLLVYFAEYFINQGLFELIYYPEISFLTHAAQYRWFQVTYQLGVFISRSSLDILKIKNIWTMSLLQFANSILFLLHASKVIHIPSFYIVIGLIIYEGLLGGFTYVNAFYRVKKEIPRDKREFAISAVTTADSLGIVIAGLTALPVHNALCLLGGFTYVNAFYRVKKEIPRDKREFAISAVTTADSLGIVIAGLTALPVHNALCKLYE